MNASIARAAPAVRTGWLGYAGPVRVDVGGIGEVAAGEVVWLLPIGVGRSAAARGVFRAMLAFPAAPLGAGGDGAGEQHAWREVEQDSLRT